jgi:hypothetical protein
MQLDSVQTQFGDGGRVEQRSPGRLFESVTPSPEDVARARELPMLTACPRRYCWWWQSLAFDWDTPVEDGCRFLSAPKSPEWQLADVPCSRCVADSGIDHYEPREPHLEADGLHRYRFCGPEHIIPDSQRPDAEQGAAADGEVIP